MRVLLGVTGGIAAYKVALVLRRLVEDGHDVRVIPTAASLNFVGRATWEALSGHPAASDTFEDVPSVAHVRLGQRADAVLVAPATADFLAQMASGRASDLLGNALLATEAPVVVAPAMHTEMWLDAATQANVALLRSRGVRVIEPAVGRLTGPDSGPGRLPDPDDLVAELYRVAADAGVLSDDGRTGESNDGSARASAHAEGWGDLEGIRLLITAGGTREPIDAVRYLGNRSSGRQGFALAEAARERGATVTVVAANVTLPLGEGIERVDVTTSAELEDAVMERRGHADAVLMVAAVADFRSATVSDVKVKKSGSEGFALELVQTTDILRSLVESRRDGEVIVGFAAETGDAGASVLEHGAAKARRKGADLLVVNEVGEAKGFGADVNSVVMLDAGGAEVARATGSKLAVAHAVLDAVSRLR